MSFRPKLLGRHKNKFSEWSGDQRVRLLENEFRRDNLIQGRQTAPLFNVYCSYSNILQVPRCIFKSSFSSTTDSQINTPLNKNEGGSSTFKNKSRESKFCYQNYSTIDLLNGIVATLRYHRTNFRYNHRRFKQYQNELTSSDRHELGRNVYTFCELYPKLPTLFGKPQMTDRKQPALAERQAILNCLLTQTVVSDKSMVRDMMEEVRRTTSSTTITTSHIQSLKQVCTPLCEDLVPLMLEMAAGLGLQCIVTIRQDLLQYKQYLKGKNRIRTNEKSILDPTTLLEALDILDDYLRQVVTIQFAPGFLDIKRITYQHSAAATIEAVAKYEAVHPVQDLNDLRARLGMNRRVFGLFHPKLVPEYIPAVVLYVSLQTIVPSSMSQIHNQEKELYQYDNTNYLYESSSSPTVATFYSISNLQAGLSGVGLGEYLIKQSVKKLQQELPTLTTFVTLSPLPDFRKWLVQRAFTSSSYNLSTLPKNDDSENLMNDANSIGVDPEDLLHLATWLKCPLNDAIWNLIQLIDKNRTAANSSTNLDCSIKGVEDDKGHVSAIPQFDHELVERILTRLAAHYLTREKYRGKPLDSVARFHTSNGAEVFRINFGADVSRKGCQNSFGIMVNYKYDLDLLQYNQDRYDFDFTIVVHDIVKQQADFVITK